MTDFLIYYEHEVRELESVILIKVELERRGYTVKVVNIGEASGLGRDDLVKSKHCKAPKVLVVSALYGNGSYVYQANFRGALLPPEKILNLQWEQVRNDAWDKIGFHFPKGKALDATHICWGERYKNDLVSNHLNPNNARVCGAVQLDLLKERFANYYKNKSELAEEFDICKDKKWILYISSFVLKDENDEKIESVSRHVGVNASSFNDLARIMRESKALTLKYIDRLLSENEDIIFIYRPHQEEDKTTLNEYTQKYKGRFVCSGQYSVKQWVKACDIINTWISTSIVEVYHAKKHCNIVRPIEVPSDIDPHIYKGSKNISNIEAFVNANKIESAFTEENFPVSKDIIDSFYDNGNLYAYERVADTLEEILHAEVNNKSKYTLSTLRRLSFYRLRYFVGHIYRSFYRKTSLDLSGMIPFKRNFFFKIERDVKYCKENADYIKTKRESIEKWASEIEEKVVESIIGSDNSV